MEKQMEKAPGKYETGWKGEGGGNVVEIANAPPMAPAAPVSTPTPTHMMHPLEAEVRQLREQLESAIAQGLKARTELDQMKPEFHNMRLAMVRVREALLSTWEPGTNGHSVASRLGPEDLHLLVRMLSGERDVARANDELSHTIRKVRDRADELDERD